MSDTYTTLSSTTDTSLAGLVATAIDHGLAAAEPTPTGDNGLTYVVPDGYGVHVVDVRLHEDLPRHRSGQYDFVGVPSLARYVERYQGDDTLAYITDVYGSGCRMLAADTKAVTVVLNDHPEDGPGHRDHVATLVL